MMKKISIFLFLFFITLSTLSWATEGELNKITGLKIEGSKTVSKTFILSNISSKIGRQFSRNILNDDIKQLYKTGYFEDVRVDFSTKKEGVEIIIAVEEKPLFSDVIIEGNRIFSKKYIKQILGFSEKEPRTKGISVQGEPINRAKLKEKISELKTLYKQKGYYLVKIQEEIDIDEEINQATVYILIDEGNKIRIRRISIEGNKEFSDKRILKLLKTKKKWWFNSGFLKEDVLKKDLENLKQFYRDAGYSDVQVGSNISYDEKMRNAFITVNIKEGNRYDVGKIIIKGNNISSEAEIKKELKLLSDTVFTDKKLREDVRSIERLYFDKGYISCSIFPKTLLNKKNNRIDIIYQIEENELTYVNRVDIKGNAITKDVVIRRELEIFPGDRFDGKKLERSYQNLRNLDYFDEGGINYYPKDTSVSNKKDLIFEVQEKKTGEFSFGGGYSSVDKGVGFVEISQRNFDINNFPTFRGGGQDLRLRAEIGRARKNYLLSWTEPWFGGRPLSVGFDLYNRTYDQGDYDENRMGGDIRLGKAFNRIWRWNLTYCLEEIEISDVSGNSENITDIKDEKEKNMISSLTGRIIRDTRDSKIDPHKGNVFTNSVEFAGLGGDKEFTKYISEINQYISPNEESRFANLVLELKLKGGVAGWHNSGVPFYERFYAGGEGTIRGYKYRKVGPRVKGEPIGGNSMLIGNAELTFPLVKKVIKGAFFYDLGNVWAKSNDIDFSDLKAGAGLGVRIKTPIAPIKLDYGYGFDPEPGEKKEGHFYFSMSRGF